MYLRFVSQAIDEDSHRPKGIFTEAYELLNNGNIAKDDWIQLRAALDWFCENLPDPPEKFAASRAIFWFRQEASDCITKVWDIVHLLRLHDRDITVQKCRHLRNIRYSDKFQVAAFPHPLDDRIIEH